MSSFLLAGGLARLTGSNCSLGVGVCDCVCYCLQLFSNYGVQLVPTSIGMHSSNIVSLTLVLRALREWNVN